jgi:hypothetical protein
MRKNRLDHAVDQAINHEVLTDEIDPSSQYAQTGRLKTDRGGIERVCVAANSVRCVLYIPPDDAGGNRSSASSALLVSVFAVTRECGNSAVALGRLWLVAVHVRTGKACTRVRKTRHFCDLSAWTNIPARA